MHASVMKTVALGAMMFAQVSFAGLTEPSAFLSPATCSCKNASDCTCPKGQCKCKKCENAVAPKRVIFESLKGAAETTALPDTARSDEARAGVLI